ncbi:MAG: hypothetical protein IT497_05865 [Ottowia sp.]|nr:hypothetical protein [Ottowia sp.]
MEFELISSSHIIKRRWDINGTLVVMPFTDPMQAQRAARLMAQRAAADGLILCVHDDHGDGFVNIVNRVFQQSESDWFCYVAQDALAGRRWLAIALHALEKKIGGLLSFNDGKWYGQLAAFGLARRSWVRKHYAGDFFHSGYRRHYADVELTLLALQEKCLVYNPDAVLVEVDWEKDIASVDAHDRAQFLQRVMTQFDGKVTNTTLLQRFS